MARGVGARMLETDAGLLAGLGCSERGPFLVVDTLDESPWKRHRFAILGQTLTLEATGDSGARFCTGRYDLALGRGEACPLCASLANDGRQQCFDCFQATGFNPAFYNARGVSPQQRARNQRPHRVYLAWFGPGSVKVGMCLAARGLSRLLEQGARLAVLLHTFDDADRARQLEERIARELGVPEAVRSARKRHLLGATAGWDDARWDDARRELREQAALAGALCPDGAGDRSILELDAYYGPPDLLARDCVDLSDTRPWAISGRCIGMVGDVLVSEAEGVRYMLSLGLAVGCRIRLRSGQRENRVGGQLGFGFWAAGFRPLRSESRAPGRACAKTLRLEQPIDGERYVGKVFRGERLAAAKNAHAAIAPCAG